MARSHIGRMLLERAAQERLKTAMDLLEGGASDKALDFYVGYALGIKWAMDMVEDIEKEVN